MGGPVNVGVFVGVEIGKAIDDGLGFVGGGGVVEPDEGMAVDFFLKDGEVAADCLDIEGRQGEVGRGGDRKGREAAARRGSSNWIEDC